MELPSSEMDSATKGRKSWAKSNQGLKIGPVEMEISVTWPSRNVKKEDEHVLV
jgi:hypothetical protein